MPTTENFNPQQIPHLAKGKDLAYDYEIGFLLFNAGNFTKSLPHLKKALQAFLEVKDFSNWTSCYAMLFQAFYELGEKSSAKKLYKEFNELCKTHNIQKNPATLALSAYYDIYTENKLNKAKDKLNTALEIAFNKHDHYIKTADRLKQNQMRFKIMLCLYFYSIYYFETGDFELCIKELKNLKILIKDYLNLKKEVDLDHAKTNNVQELQLYHKIREDLKKNSTNIQRMSLGLKFMVAKIELNYKKNIKESEQLLWEIYEQANKTNYTLFVPYILSTIALCYIKMDNKKQAQMFFNLAEKSSRSERKLLLLYINSLKKKHGMGDLTEKDAYDLVFDIKERLIIEKQKGCVDLKNQFILVDLLQLFLLNPGTFYSKEEIIKLIWNQDYDPDIHDNKIYVTIKRLREMIEKDAKNPVYIQRATAGYYFPTKVKTLVKQ